MPEWNALLVMATPAYPVKQTNNVNIYVLKKKSLVVAFNTTF
jgi:hypothetical protein